jgi:hypothetical protein
MRPIAIDPLLPKEARPAYRLRKRTWRPDAPNRTRQIAHSISQNGKSCHKQETAEAPAL